MKNNGLIFRARCLNFVCKLNIYQLEVLKNMVDTHINKLKREGLKKHTLSGQKIK